MCSLETIEIKNAWAANGYAQTQQANNFKSKLIAVTEKKKHPIVYSAKSTEMGISNELHSGHSELVLFVVSLISFIN